jgi:DNA-binding response OmpR family regulator
MNLMPEHDARQTIFVVEDDPDVSLLIRANLQNAGFRTEPFSNVISALAKARVEPPSLFLLDIMMPGEDGLEFCMRLRAMPQFAATPIIFVTAKTSEEDRILGLECGGDDYITKPFSPRELVARVKAALRVKQCEADVIKIGELEIDRAAMCLRVRGATKLTTTVEFRIIEALALSPGRVFSRDRILRIVGSDVSEVDTRTVDVFISRIRAKIEDDPRNPSYLRTVRGAGYRFVAPANLTMQNLR